MITDVPDNTEPDIQHENFFQDSLNEEPTDIPSLEDRMSAMEITMQELVSKQGELVTSVNSVGSMVQDAVDSVTQATESFNNGGMSRLFKGVFGNGG